MNATVQFDGLADGSYEWTRYIYENESDCGSGDASTAALVTAETGTWVDVGVAGLVSMGQSLSSLLAA